MIQRIYSGLYFLKRKSIRLSRPKNPKIMDIMRNGEEFFSGEKGVLGALLAEIAQVKQTFRRR